MSAVIKTRRDRNLAKSDMIEVEGVVVESLPNTTFQVDIGNGHTILAHISGKLRMNFIRILSAYFRKAQNELHQDSAR